MRNFTSPAGYVMFYLIHVYEHNLSLKHFFFCCKRCILSCSHSNGNTFMCADNTQHVVSRAKISCFCEKAHYLVFHYLLYKKKRIHLRTFCKPCTGKMPSQCLSINPSLLIVIKKHMRVHIKCSKSN